MAASVFSELQQVYEQAQQRLVAIKAEWDRQGGPLLSEGSMGQLIEHPLVKLLRETEVEVMRLGTAVGAKGRRGPEVKAVATAKVGESPRKLRAAS